MLDVIKIIKNSDYHNYLVFKMLEGNCVACSCPCFAFREEIHIFDMNGNYSIRAVLQRYRVFQKKNVTMFVCLIFPKPINKFQTRFFLLKTEINM